MSVKRKVLEGKTDKELTQYLQDDNTFVPQACQFAYEILQSRGRIFTPEEIERIKVMISKKYEKDKIIVHENHKKAAYLIYISASLGIINLMLSPELHFSLLSIFTVLIIIAIIFEVGYFISKGSNGAKYIVLIIMIFGLIYIPLIMSNMISNPIVGFINIMQTVLQICAITLLFQIPKAK